MDTMNRCMYCMQDNAGQDICPHCGKNAAAPVIKNHLTPGDVLGGRFLVGRAVGQDAFGVVYMVYDLRKGNVLRIREYLPRGAAFRNPGETVLSVTPGMEEKYRAGLESMLMKAESASDPENAMAHFEENNTLYVVLRHKKAAAASAAAVTARPPREEGDEGAPGAEEEEEADDEDEDEEEGETFFEKVKRRLPIILAGAVVIAVLVIAGVMLINNNARDRHLGDSDRTPSPFDEWKAPTATPLATMGADNPIGEITQVIQDWQYQQGGYDLSDGRDTTAVPEDYEPDWLTAVTPEPTPTATPGPEQPKLPSVTMAPQLITNKTKQEVIYQLQDRLIDLLWLAPDYRSGQYDDQTKAAVKSFQKYIHDNYEPTMDVDGIAGQQTIAWLNKRDCPMNLEALPSPTPTLEPTPTPFITPTPEPTSTPYLPDPEYVRRAQKRLVEKGWMYESQQTGAYDNATRLALIDYQNYVNLLYPTAQLNNQGVIDDNTLMWLEWSQAPAKPVVTPSPTPTPTPSPTPTPEPAHSQPIGEYSSVEEITWLQNRLAELSWLTPEAVNGQYDELTRTAVTNLQRYLIQRYTLDLQADGECGVVTVSYLNNSYTNPVNPKPEQAVGPTATPEVTDTPAPVVTDTPEPVATPTPAPTDAPMVDDPIPSQLITGKSDPAVITKLQARLNQLGWLTADCVSGQYGERTRTAVSAFQQYIHDHFDSTVDVDGMAGPQVIYWLNWVDSPANPDPVEPTPEPTAEPTEEPTPEPTEEPTPEPTEEPTPEPTEEPTPEPTEEPTEEPTPEPTEEPTPEPTEEPTPDPTEEPTPEPTEEPTPEPTEEPTPEPTEGPGGRLPQEVLEGVVEVNRDSDSEQIAAVQRLLIDLGWLDESAIQMGVYDEISTDFALENFVNAANANWLSEYSEVTGLSQLPYHMPMVVDSATLQLLLSDYAPTAG